MVSKELQYKNLYEKTVTVCEIENKQKHELERKVVSLKDTIHNLTQIKIADSECYAVIGKYNGTGGSYEARMKCLACGVIDLNPIYIYCPNCGRKFKS